MMSADRTAIRRRLTVGRAAHRPPWSGRKAGHRSIVAPLAATLAATMAVGVGVVIAKAERERRASRRRSTDHRLGLLADELLAGGLKRTAVGQLDLAIEMLEREHLDGEIELADGR